MEPRGPCGSHQIANKKQCLMIDPSVVDVPWLCPKTKPGATDCRKSVLVPIKLVIEDFELIEHWHPAFPDFFRFPPFETVLLDVLPKLSLAAGRQ